MTSVSWTRQQRPACSAPRRPPSSPIQTYETFLQWAHHSILLLSPSPLPTTLIYSHDRSPVPSLWGECKHTDRCRGHLRPMWSFTGLRGRKSCDFLCVCVCVCVRVSLWSPYSRNHNRALPGDSHVFWGNEHNGVFSVFVCPGTQWYVTYCTLDKVMKEWMQEFFLPRVCYAMETEAKQIKQNMMDNIRLHHRL